MTWDPELDVMCQIPIQWEAWFEDRPKGTRGYRTARTVKVFSGPAAPAAQGVFQEQVGRRLLIIPPYDATGAPISAITERDRFTWPEGFAEPRTPAVKSAEPIFDERGSLHHFEVIT